MDSVLNMSADTAIAILMNFCVIELRRIAHWRKLKQMGGVQGPDSCLRQAAHLQQVHDVGS